jgi:hypothetical protein
MLNNYDDHVLSDLEFLSNLLCARISGGILDAEVRK